MSDVQAALDRLGIALPSAPKPVAAYVPAVVWGGLCFTSGQLPFREGEIAVQGLVGSEVSLIEAQDAARIAAINALAVAAEACGGINHITGVIKVTGFVQSAGGFHEQPSVMNGASELFQALFGDAGQHARSAVGCAALPLDAAVEVECIFRVSV